MDILNYTYIDLEMNQPSGKIIQIGLCIGEPLSGALKHREKFYVNCHETLNPMIIALTGITQPDVDNGMELQEAYEKVTALHKQFNCFINGVTWGGGDTIELRDQLGMDKERFCFGRRWIDTKTLFQAWRHSQSQPVQGGLAKSLIKLSLRFEGRKHDAGDDAFNTFRMHAAILKKFRP